MKFDMFKINTPGKGVKKSASEHSAPAQFFITLYYRLPKIIALNFIYFIALIPTILLAGFAYFSVVPVIEGTGEIELLYMLSPIAYFPSLQTFALLLTVALVITAPLAGPATAALTYVMRDYCRRESPYLWQDFIGQFKSNFKQATIVAVLDGLILGVGLINLLIYLFGILTGEAGFVMRVMFFIFVGVILFYGFLRNYLYIILVTFKVSIKQLYKNAMLLAAASIFRNLILNIFISAFVLFLFFTNPLLGIIFLPLLVFGLCSYIITFVCYPVVNKFMIQPYLEGAADSPQESVKEENIFSDDA
jgi:uncharacterized membrane protein YesL